MKLGLIVVAQNIPNAIINRFKSGVLQSDAILQPTIHIGGIGVKTDKFYKTRILNTLLRECLPKYDIIIQTDIDLLIPPGLIQHSIHRITKHPTFMYHHVLRYIQERDIPKTSYTQYPWKRWSTLKHKLCSGCWNVATADTWKRSGGWNEDMFEWGAEDTEFMARTKRKGIIWEIHKSFGLVHVAHPRRTSIRPKENAKLGGLYSTDSDWLTRDIRKR